MIGLEEMAEALSRWQKLVEVAAPVDTEERVEATRDRLARGEDLQQLLAEYAEFVQSGQGAAPSTLYATARSVGLDAKACSAFIIGMSALLRDSRLLPIEVALDGAAFAGLFVGLTARQLVEEEG